LYYHQGSNVRYEEVKASNLCDRILIFDSFYFIALLSIFYFYSLIFNFFSILLSPPSPLSCLVFFYHPPFFSLLFHLCFDFFFTYMVFFSSIPNLLGTTRFGYCCCHLIFLSTFSFYLNFQNTSRA
jgi:hypothetical protein